MHMENILGLVCVVYSNSSLEAFNVSSEQILRPALILFFGSWVRGSANLGATFTFWLFLGLKLIYAEPTCACEQ